MRRVIVVGGGLAGLSATIGLAEQGIHVTLVTLTPAKRSHSVCAQGGINAAMNIKEQDDSPALHAYDTLRGGDFLANQTPVIEMCVAAPQLIEQMTRWGCPFHRDASGGLDARRFGGTLYHRTIFCGSSTGQQLLYTLDEQVRRQEVQGLVHRKEHHEFLRLLRDEDGRSRGILLMNLFHHGLEILQGDAVVFATGGLGWLFQYSTNSSLCTGAASGRLFQEGMDYANGEFIQVHPTAMRGSDKSRLISESVRGEGGRIWVYGNSDLRIEHPDGSRRPCGETGKPWYFLEDLYPAYGNLAARDVTSRAILQVCQLGLGVDGEAQVYLDATHLSATAHQKVLSVLDLYKKFTGDDPKTIPMKIYPAVHYSMGGAWVDWPSREDPDLAHRFRHMTNLPGCFQCGESDYEYHGANRLGANSLLSCIFSGFVVGIEVPRYLDSTTLLPFPMAKALEVQRTEEERIRALYLSSHHESSPMLYEELRSLMMSHMTVMRCNTKLQETLVSLQSLKERAHYIQLNDSHSFANHALQKALQLIPMIDLAEAMTYSSLLRNECRGAHYKLDTPPRNDSDWLKTTIASYTPDGPKVHYKPVDLSYIEPQQRDYTKKTPPPIWKRDTPAQSILDAR